MNDINVMISNRLPTFSVTINNRLPTFYVTVKLSNNASNVNVSLATPGPKGGTGIKGDPGNLIICKAAYSIGGHRVVSINSDNEAEYPSNISRAVGLTTNAATTGDYLNIQTSGLISEISWNWIPEKAIYFLSDGTLTQTVPISGTLLQIGFAVSSTEMFIKLGTPIFLN